MTIRHLRGIRDRRYQNQPPPPLVSRRELDQIEFAILEKTLLAFEPMLEIAVMQTMTMSDNITAYSTAAGPSSLARKRHELLGNDSMMINSLGEKISFR